MRKIINIILLLLFYFNNSLALKWTTEKTSDDWEETTRTIIFSDTVTPNKPLDFPYSNPTVYMYWDCDNGGFVMRNTANNITDTDTEDGYDLISHDIKIDNQKKSIKSYQKWGSEFIIIDYYDSVEEEFANELIIRLNHYGDGYRQYKFDLSNFDSVGGCK